LGLLREKPVGVLRELVRHRGFPRFVAYLMARRSALALQAVVYFGVAIATWHATRAATLGIGTIAMLNYWCG
jgi:hypothetical protein